ncbi:hypothetical protein KA344_06190 [bacterium]|jgi:hypothetical protein|nr:hypothetical protein [bacterium]
MKVARAMEIFKAFLSIGLTLVCAGTFTTEALAQGQQDGQLLKMAFEAKDYQVTSRLAADMIRRQPNNSLAHYYLGCSLVRLGKMGQGRSELTKCQSLSRGTDLEKLADSALAELLPYDVRVEQSAVEPKLSTAHTTERQRLLSEQEKELQIAQKRFDEKVNQLQKSSTPEQLKVATQAEFAQLSKEQIAITERYQRRADALLRRGSPSSLGAQMGSAPSSANSRNVQNFVHSGDASQAASIPSENPMHASALKLSAGGSKGAARTSGKSHSSGK